MRKQKSATSAKAPDSPNTVNHGLTKVGWGQGELSDGRPWLATLLEDRNGHRSLAFAFKALAHELDDEAVLLSLVEEGLIVPEESCDIECLICEKHDYSPSPIWVIEVLLCDWEKQWALPGFTVQALKEYRLH